MYGVLNVLSLVLGILSWVLGVAAAVRRDKRFSAASFCLCALSLACQIFYTQRLVTIRDWAAIEDTHTAVAVASAVLLAGNLLLNLSVLVKRK